MVIAPALAVPVTPRRATELRSRSRKLRRSSDVSLCVMTGERRSGHGQRRSRLPTGQSGPIRARPGPARAISVRNTHAPVKDWRGEPLEVPSALDRLRLRHNETVSWRRVQIAPARLPNPLRRSWSVAQTLTVARQVPSDPLGAPRQVVPFECSHKVGRQRCPPPRAKRPGVVGRSLAKLVLDARMREIRRARVPPKTRRSGSNACGSDTLVVRYFM